MLKLVQMLPVYLPSVCLCDSISTQKKTCIQETFRSPGWFSEEPVKVRSLVQEWPLECHYVWARWSVTSLDKIGAVQFSASLGSGSHTVCSAAESQRGEDSLKCKWCAHPTPNPSFWLITSTAGSEN